MNNLKILMFHRVLPDKEIEKPNAYFSRGTAITESKFIEILNKIKDLNYKVLTFLEFSEKLRSNKSFENCICLTFDDGYIDNYTIAFPILKNYNFTATFFPILDFCFHNKISYLDFYYQIIDSCNFDSKEREEFIKGKTKKRFLSMNEKEVESFLSELQSENDLNLSYSYNNYMNESQIRELIENGNEIGSHTMSHRILTLLEKKEIEYELIESKRLIQTLTGSHQISFCYPHGKFNQSIIHLLKKSNYKFACTVQLDSKDFRWAIPRIFVKENTNIEDIFQY